MAHKLTLFQYEICPFCSKIKGILDFNRIPYKTVEVNPMTKTELIGVDFRQRKVPFAIFPDGSRISDSPVIVQALRDRSLIRDQTVSVDEWRKWEKFADTKLSVLLFPNITRTVRDSWQAFGYINGAPKLSDTSKFMNRSLGSLAMAAANPRLKRKHGIVDEQAAILAGEIRAQKLVPNMGLVDCILLALSRIYSIKVLTGDAHFKTLSEAEFMGG